jgi:hypothetical protein
MRIDIAGWLQDISEKADEVREALWNGTLPDLATQDEDATLQAILKETFTALEIYERQCREKVRRESDPGPSQEQRL